MVWCNLLGRQSMNLRTEEVTQSPGDAMKGHHVTTGNLLLLLKSKMKGQR